MKSFKLSLLGGLLFAATSSFAATNIVENGSFQDNSIGDNSWEYLSSVTGWTSTGMFEIQKGSNDGGLSGFDKAYAGSQYLELNSTQLTTVSQVLNTTKGTTYDLSFAFAGRPDTPGSAPSKMAVFWNGVDIGTVTAGANSGWIKLDYDNLVATSGHTTLSFESLGPTSAASYGSELDAVRVSAVTRCISPVPEPSTYGLLLTGLCLMGFVARSRQQR